MLRNEIDPAPLVNWPAGGDSRVPYKVFMDVEIHAAEQRRIFQGPVWQYLCLAVEVPQPGDYRTTFAGAAPVVVTRDEDGALHAFENRCVHKGSLVCLKDRGNAKMLTCVYHNWTYGLDGALRSVAFRNGIKGLGGMPEEFRVEDHRMRPLRVAELAGMIFGSYAADPPPLADYIGPEIVAKIHRVLNRPVRVLGYYSQYLNNNWKLYVENVKDSYHAGLLHMFFATFRINRLASAGGVVVSPSGGNHISYSQRRTIHESAEYDDAKLRATKRDYRLADPSLLDAVDEFGDGVNIQILTVFPNFVLQQVENTIAVRQVLPKGVGETELNWTVLGFADDDAAMTAMRLKQANLIGPAGYISMEDGAVGGFVQRAVQGAADETSIVQMGGYDHASQATRTTEASVRGFWHAWRGHMGL